MKEIIFNATSLNDKPNGLSLYCKNVLQRMDMSLINEVAITSEYDGLDESNIKVKKIDIKSENKLVSVFKRNLNYRRYIKNKSRSHKLAVYSPTQHGLNIRGIDQIVTIHDLIPLYYPKGRLHQYIYYKYILPKVAKKANKIITVSENTKRDIMKFYDISEEKIEVIYNGFDEGAPIDIEKSKNLIFEEFKIKDFILMVGINYSYKNLHSVISAFASVVDRTNLNLVIAGNEKNSYGKELMEQVKNLGLESRVVFMGYVPDKFKNYLYQAASMFIYPSLYEGFGLPILESMSNGVPVICSNTSSLPEVGGDGAIYIDTTNISEIEEAILYVCNMSYEEKQALINKGLNRCKEFSWEKCVTQVENTLKVYLQR